MSNSNTSERTTVQLGLQTLATENSASEGDSLVLDADLNPSFGSPSGGSQPVLAQVVLVGSIASWDGSALPFDHVSHDPDGLWDATSHQFVAQAAGWYQVLLWTRQESSLGIRGTSAGISIQNSGAGDNLLQQRADSLGQPILPMTGVTHLAVGDTLDVEGIGSNLEVAAGVVFSIYLVAAD